MLVYNLYLLVNFIFGFLIRADNTKGLLGIVFLLSSLFIGLREGIGADWGNYFRLYQNAESYSLTESIFKTDPLYGFISFTSHFLNFNIYFVNFVCAAIFCYGAFYSFLRIAKKYELYLISITPYLLIVAGPNFTRQSMAIGFFLISIKLIYKNRDKLAALAAFASLLSHSSAIFAVLICAYVYIKENNVSRKYIMVMGSVLLFCLVPLLPRVIDKFYFYTEEVSRSSSGVIFRLLLYSVPFVLFVLKRKTIKKNYYYSFISASFILYCACFILTFIDSIIGDRVSIYTIPAQAIIFSAIALETNYYYEKIFIYFLCVAFSIAQLNIWLNFSVWAEKAWLPYSNYIFGVF